jgi:hypothetical protein
LADNLFYKNKEVEYKLYAIAFLKKLKYLDYELIDDDTRSSAIEKHREDLSEQETKINDAGTSEDQERFSDPALKDAKIDCTVGMIWRLIKEDPESSKLTLFKKFVDILTPHEQNIEENTSKYQNEMK